MPTQAYKSSIMPYSPALKDYPLGRLQTEDFKVIKIRRRWYNNPLAKFINMYFSSLLTALALATTSSALPNQLANRKDPDRDPNGVLKSTKAYKDVHNGQNVPGWCTFPVENPDNKNYLIATDTLNLCGNSKYCCPKEQYCRFYVSFRTKRGECWVSGN